MNVIYPQKFGHLIKRFSAQAGGFEHGAAFWWLVNPQRCGRDRKRLAACPGCAWCPLVDGPYPNRRALDVVHPEETGP